MGKNIFLTSVVVKKYFLIFYFDFSPRCIPLYEELCNFLS